MKKFIYILSFLFIGALTANAYVDSQFTSSEQFLKNSGYSNDAVKAVNFGKKDPYSPVEEKKDTRSILRKIYNYIDPCSETDRAFPTHEINPRNNWQDL